jgi:hypothetical protein
MRRLLDGGVSPRISDRDGVSALHVAVACNQAAAVGLLLERGAPVDATSAVLSTPLHLAAAVENVEIARTLIAKGARTSAMDQRGQTPWERVPDRSKAAFAALGCAPAAEHGPTITAAVSVLRVISGEEVEIAAQAGGRTVGVRVRLIWLRSPDPRDGTALGWEDPATAALTAMLPAGSQIRLWSPGPFFPLDTRGRTLALVLMGAEGEDSAQERLVGAGMAAYWRRYGAAPEPWHSRLSQAQQRAAQAQAGAWARITSWMRMQADEEQSIR